MNEVKSHSGLDNLSVSTKVVLTISVLVTLIFCLTFALVVFDQITYSNSEVEKRFSNEKNSSISVNQKGMLLIDAAYSEMKKELDSTLGWCPNDLIIWPASWLDNRCNRQMGVWYSTGKAMTLLSERITKLGMGDDENQYTKKARLHLANFPDQWGWGGARDDASENHFTLAGEFIDDFRQLVIKNESDKTRKKLINIRSDDFVQLIEMIVGDGGILSEPFGRLTARNANLPWSELDDTVYNAQGSARVARNILVALKSTFPEELARGGMENLDVAIEALDAASNFNPWWITRGEGPSLWADHRAKIQRYYNDAFRRLNDLQASLKT